MRDQTSSFLVSQVAVSDKPQGILRLETAPFIVPPVYLSLV
jgi:hypothetical protein